MERAKNLMTNVSKAPESPAPKCSQPSLQIFQMSQQPSGPSQEFKQWTKIYQLGSLRASKVNESSDAEISDLKFGSVQVVSKQGRAQHKLSQVGFSSSLF